MQARSIRNDLVELRLEMMHLHNQVAECQNGGGVVFLEVQPFGRGLNLEEILRAICLSDWCIAQVPSDSLRVAIKAVLAVWSFPLCQAFRQPPIFGEARTNHHEVWNGPRDAENTIQVHHVVC